MGELVFVGLGLHSEMGMSLLGLEETKTADHIFMEMYTSVLPGFSTNHFAELTGKRPHLLTRRDLEEDNGQVILNAAKTGKAVLLVPGDPLIATTHVALRIEAEKRRISTRIIHGASILSAAIGLSGLHSYKFGKSVTIPFPDSNPSVTPYTVICGNRRLGLHTLCFLDIKAEEERCLSIREALEELLRIETIKKEKAVTLDTLVVAVARAGSDHPTVKADTVRDIIGYDFGQPPQSLIFPGRLHFMEAEALKALAAAPETVRGLQE